LRCARRPDVRGIDWRDCYGHRQRERASADGKRLGERCATRDDVGAPTWSAMKGQPLRARKRVALPAKYR
jgi:hypothetical protein